MSKTTLHLPANAPGPRGIHTKEHGDVLLAPGEVRDGLTLSDEEHGRLKALGIVKGKPEADQAATVIGAAGLGAGEGFNHPDKPNADDPDKPGADDETKPKAFKDMNRTELDAAVTAAGPGFKLPEDATTNAKIADALQAHADAQQPQS